MSRDLLDIASASDSWRVARQLLGRRRPALVAAVLAFCVLGVAQLVGPWLMGRTVDVVAREGDRGTILGYAVWIGVAAVVGGLAAWLAQASLARAAEPALAELREDVVDRVLRLSYRRVERAGAGDLLSRVGDDVREVGRSISTVVPDLVGSLVAVGFTAVGLFALDWRLGLAGVAAGPAYLLALRWYLPRSGPYYQRQRVAQGERSEALVAGLHGAPTLRAFRLEGRQVEHIDRASWHAARISLDVFGLLIRFGSRNNRAELIGLLAVLGTGFLLVRGNEASVGEVTAAALFFHRLFNPIGMLVFLFDEAQAAGASLSRLVGVTLLPVEPEPPARDLERGPLEVTVHRHEYDEGRPVLEAVRLVIRPGERVALVGESGAGKTTLGAIAAGILEPTVGEVRLSGAGYRDLSRADLRRRVALVSQDVHVFSGSVREAVTLAAPRATDAEVTRALETVGAAAWVAGLPQRLDTVVGEHGQRLTAAQAQQLALARVALLGPWFVVLDEATAEAGSSGARELEVAAMAVTEGRGALVIAHRLSQAALADRVLVMADGRVVEEGTHAELLAAGGRYRRLWSAWSGELRPDRRLSGA